MDTNFTNDVTLTDATWFNDVNDTIYHVLGNGTTAPADAATARINLGITSTIPVGGLMMYGASSAPAGWVLADGSAISRTTFAALFAVYGITWGAGDGSTTFNVPAFGGRTPVGIGTSTDIAAGSNADVDTTTDGFTVTTNLEKWTTGKQVVFALASGTITGLTSGNTYFVIRSSATLIKLATTLALAQAGTAIDLTAKSTPVWTITYTTSTRALADAGGNETKAMTNTELPLHTHTDAGHAHNFTIGVGAGAAVMPQVTASTATTTVPSQFSYSTSTATAAIQTTGGNAAMNVMNPFLGITFIIKT